MEHGSSPTNYPGRTKPLPLLGQVAFALPRRSGWVSDQGSWSNTTIFHNTLVVGSSPMSSTTQSPATGEIRIRLQPTLFRESRQGRLSYTTHDEAPRRGAFPDRQRRHRIAGQCPRNDLIPLAEKLFEVPQELRCAAHDDLEVRPRIDLVRRHYLPRN